LGNWGRKQGLVQICIHIALRRHFRRHRTCLQIICGSAAAAKDGKAQRKSAAARLGVRYNHAGKYHAGCLCADVMRGRAGQGRHKQAATRLKKRKTTAVRWRGCRQHVLKQVLQMLHEGINTVDRAVRCRRERQGGSCRRVGTAGEYRQPRLQLAHQMAEKQVGNGPPKANGRPPGRAEEQILEDSTLPVQGHGVSSTCLVDTGWITVASLS